MSTIANVATRLPPLTPTGVWYLLVQSFSLSEVQSVIIMVHLPLEILGMIIEIIISEYHGDTIRAIKRFFCLAWFVVPLIRVCKEWYPFVERFLYQSISVGDKFPHRISQIEGESRDGE